MKSLFKKKRSSIVGLDIGTRQIKAVWLEQTKDSFILQSYACERVDTNAFSGREVKDHEAISTALDNVKQALKPNTALTNIAVAGTSVISKAIELDSQHSDFDLETLIEIEAESLIPYPIEDVYVDFEILTPSQTRADKVNVLLTSARKSAVDERLLITREACFEPNIVDIESYAICNALNFFHPSASSGLPICCVNVGASLTQICVMHDGHVVYTKEQAFGLNHLIRDISAMYILETEIAEQHLYEGTLPDNRHETLLPTFAANLYQHINKAFHASPTTIQGAAPTKILLSGGAATIPRLVDTLRQEVEMDVTCFNPFNHLSINPRLNKTELDEIAPQLVIAAGLASRNFTPCHT